MRETTRAQKKLISIASAEIGYREGPNNWTKYAEDPGIQKLYGWKPQNQPWCCTFVNWCFLQTFGYDLGSRLTYGGTAACANSADLFRPHGALVHFPQVGDQAFYYSGGRINHTGLVVQVDGSAFIAIEGNYSDRVSSVRHNIGDANVAGFGRPCWEILPKDAAAEPSPTDGSGGAAVSDPDTTPQETAKTCRPELPEIRQGDTGTAVERLQTLLIGRGYFCGGRSYGGREQPDGEFGPATLVAVRDLQQAANLTQDGIVGEATWPVLINT